MSFRTQFVGLLKLFQVVDKPINCIFSLAHDLHGDAYYIVNIFHDMFIVFLWQQIYVFHWLLLWTMLMKTASARYFLQITTNHLQHGKTGCLVPSLLAAIRILRSFETSANCSSNNRETTVNFWVKLRGKARPNRRHQGPEDCRSTASLTSALDVGLWSTPRPGRFTLQKEMW